MAPLNASLRQEGRRFPGGAVVAFLADGVRLHCQHGPIDVILEGEYHDDRRDDRRDDRARIRAYEAVACRFSTLLQELVEELPLLRLSCPFEGLAVRGRVARKMTAAVRLHAPRRFITPMAAVAGSVADEILETLLQASPLPTRLYVNNGGDIALYLAPEAQFTIKISDFRGLAYGYLRIDGGGGRGLATSGRGGRSLSMGIADAVTVVASTAAAADAAATLIANSVDCLDHEQIARAPANAYSEESDLGTRAVVVNCGRLASRDVDCALGRGADEARRLRAEGLIEGAFLCLHGESRLIHGKGLFLLQRNGDSC